MESIEEYIYEHKEENDFFLELQELLDTIKPSREAAENLLDTIGSYDIRELYETLLDDSFGDFLTDDELSKLNKDYSSLFVPYEN